MSGDGEPMSTKTYSFAEFQLDPTKRVLLKEGQPVQLNQKALELLLVLMERRGEVLSKQDLLDTVWPEQIVEENNLTVQISALRKALGEKKGVKNFIVTIPGRGYSFVAEVAEAGELTDVIIESRSFERITIDESADEDEAAPLGANASSLPYVLRTEQKRMELATVEPRVKQPKAQLRKGAIAGIVLGGLLLAGAGLGFYRHRQSQTKQNHQAVTVAPAVQQMAIKRLPVTGKPLTAAVSPDGKSLVYVQQEPEGQSLWLGQTSATSSVMIRMPENISYGTPVFAPDGQTIYFTVQGKDRPRPVLMKMAVVGGPMTELIVGVNSPVAFAPNGQQIAFIRNIFETEGTALIIANSSDGKAERKLVERGFQERLSTTGLSWSPDGRTIAVSSRLEKEAFKSRVELVSIEDGSVTVLGEKTWMDLHRVTWLSSGNGLIVVAVEVDPSWTEQLWHVSYPQGVARRITNDLDKYHASSLSLSSDDDTLIALRVQLISSIWTAPQGDTRRARQLTPGILGRYEGMFGLWWTPDERLVYGAFSGDSQTIWMMDADGSNQRQLTPDGSVDSILSVTRDGRYIVFHSARSGHFEIWRTNLDGSNPRQLTTGGNNYQPGVSPDGRWVFFRSTRENKGNIWKVSIDGGEMTEFIVKRSAWPVVSPDGKYIACSYLDAVISERRLLGIIPFEGGEPIKTFEVPPTASLWYGIRWSPDGKALYYRDARKGLWRQALHEDQPQRVGGFDDITLYNFAWSFDGETMAYVTGTETREIVLLKNFIPQ